MRCLVVLLVGLGAQAAWAGSFIRLPSKPPADEAAASAPAPAEAAQAPPAAPAEPADPAGTAEKPATADAEANAADAAPEEATGRAEPVGEPTYGEACIYGPQGLLYEPRDTVCPETPDAPAARRSADPTPGAGGACIFGEGGRILYQPDGVECEGRVRPVRDPRRDRPRGRRYRR